MSAASALARPCRFELCGRPAFSGEHCEPHYRQRLKGGPLKPLRVRFVPRRGSSLEERILAQTKRVGECLLWTGQKHPNGFARFVRDGVSVSVHRALWELARGPIRRGEHLTRTCGNRLCVEVAHMRSIAVAYVELDEAKRAVVMAYDALAKSLVRRWTSRSPQLRPHAEDLLQAARLGLAQGVASHGENIARMMGAARRNLRAQAALILSPVDLPDEWTAPSPGLARLVKAAISVGEDELGPIGLAALRHANLIGGPL